MAAAKSAQPSWAAQSFAARAATLAKALGRLENDIERRAAVFVRENGKPLAEARGEIASVPKRQRMALAYAPELDAGRSLAAPHGRTFVFDRPYGVVVSIVPWNSPLALAFTQIVAALLAGNCVVLKPPETCPLALIRAVMMFAEELPAGTMNVVTGLPGEIGDALTTHPDVGKIGFTGSIPSARHIMANAAQTIKGVTLELGGNDAAIILDDAAFDPPTMKAMLDATFYMTGQVCMAIKRTMCRPSAAMNFCNHSARPASPSWLATVLSRRSIWARSIPERRNRGPKACSMTPSAAAPRWSELGRIDSEATFASGYFMRPVVVTGDCRRRAVDGRRAVLPRHTGRHL